MEATLFKTQWVIKKEKDEKVGERELLLGRKVGSEGGKKVIRVDRTKTLSICMNT